MGGRWLRIWRLGLQLLADADVAAMWPYYPPCMRPVIYCADVGSIANGRFGWARSAADETAIDRHRGGTEIVELVDGVADDLTAGHEVAFGFECPLFVPVPNQPLRRGMAQPGESNRSWSAGAGAIATGIVEVAWILSKLCRRGPEARPYLDWAEFAAAGRGLFVWEAFVADRAKGVTHVDDATVAVAAFCESLPDPTARNAVTAERLSLFGAALLWSGWSSDADLLRTPCLAIRAAPPPGAGAGRAAAQSQAAALDPTRTPRAHRDRREIQRKRQLLEAPHVAPLTQFVQRLGDAHGGAVSWFDPTEAGVEAPILLLFENPGRRADAAQRSGFISANNDDTSAENMWQLFREAGIDRRRDIVALNIVPWYLGDDRKIGGVRAGDIEEARPALHQLLQLLPQLRVVVLFGRNAQAGWRRAQPPIHVRVLEAPHPSGRRLNGHPEDRAVIVAQLREARRLTRE
jgi:uracil-DNA glycosylase